MNEVLTIIVAGIKVVTDFRFKADGDAFFSACLDTASL